MYNFYTKINREKTMKKIMISIPLIFQITSALASPCVFNDKKTSFNGTPVEQAECLLRPVLLFGHIGKQKNIPSFLKTRLEASNIDFTLLELRQYLKKEDIHEEDLGGSINITLHPKTKYFLIHDTSYNQGAKDFPKDMNSTWSGNKLSKSPQKAHIFINRRGESITQVNTSENWRATKFELKDGDRRNLFINVELIQPRRSYPIGTDKNDALAPTPGFTKEQLRRLAVIYYTNSLRAGHYLIPAFHAVIDTGFKDGHDDPQNFDLDEFDRQLEDVYKSIRTTHQ